MTKEEIRLLASSEVQDYIFTHANDDEKKLLLKHKLILGIPTTLIAQQIAARRKAETKLPLFHKTKGIVFPPSLNLEQSSSEATAKLKSRIVTDEIEKQSIKAADLTGGFGVDSLFFSQVVESLDYVEPNQELVELVKHNSEVLKTLNIHFHNHSAEDFLNATSQQYDFIFIDPSRRDSKARKVFSLADCAPDINQLLPSLLNRSNFILLKASPLLDIKQGLRELRAVKKVLVVSVANECKELLFLMEKGFDAEPLIQTVNLDYEGTVRHAFDFKFSEEEALTSTLSPPKKYLYEPNASILKAGAFKLIGEKFQLNKIQVNTHLYTSDVLTNDFPGRIFEIGEFAFDKKSSSETQANIITRNYPLSPEELKKKLKLKDGGEKYVIAFSGQEKKHIVLAKRLV